MGRGSKACESCKFDSKNLSQNKCYICGKQKNEKENYNRIWNNFNWYLNNFFHIMMYYKFTSVLQLKSALEVMYETPPTWNIETNLDQNVELKCIN